MTTFDELFAEHNLTPNERKALVMHLATLRAQKTVEALQDCPLAAAPSTPPPAVVGAVPPLGDAEAVYIIRTTPMGGSRRERDVNLVRAAFDVGVTAAEAHHGIAPKAAQPVAGAVATEPSEEIQELRAQVEAWRKQCETLTNQVICCGVAARHPDATLTTRGAYAGKWNSPQAEEVRKLRAERDALLAASPRPEPSAQGEQVATVTEKMVTAYLTANDAYWKRIDGEPTKLGKWRNGTPSEATRVSLMAALASAPSTPPPAVVEAVPLTDEQADALRRLWPAIEKAMGCLVFTAEQAGAVQADMNTIRHGIAPKAAQEKT